MDAKTQISFLMDSVKARTAERDCARKELAEIKSKLDEIRAEVWNRASEILSDSPSQTCRWFAKEFKRRAKALSPNQQEKDKQPKSGG